MALPRIRVTSRTPRPLALRAPWAACIALVAVSAPAVRAQPITYTVSGTASGTLGGTAFSGAALALTFTGADASGPYNGPSPIPPNVRVFGGLTEFLTLTSGSTTVSGQVASDAYVFDFTDAPRFGTGYGGGFSFAGLISTNTYDLRGPFTSPLQVDQFSRLALPAAGLTITGITNARLVATVSTIPEPSTWALVGTGLLTVGGVAVRRKHTRV